MRVTRGRHNRAPRGCTVILAGDQSEVMSALAEAKLPDATWIAGE